MKRTAGTLMMLAALGGCSSTNQGHMAGGGCPTGGCGSRQARSVPGVQGPWGTPVAMAAPYTASPPSGEAAARAMMARHLPLDMVQMAGMPGAPAGGGIQLAGGQHTAGSPTGIIPAHGMISPPGLPHQPALPGMGPQPGAVAAVGSITGATSPYAARRTEVRFAGPTGMKISWYAAGAGGKGDFTPTQLEAPARYNFVQAALYRLKLTNIPKRPGVELYPTIEVVPGNNRTEAFLAHSAVPLNFTDEDFDQVAAGNYLVKVIYLPDPQYQDLATVGLDEIVSTRLEPGVNPIEEAYKRGSILLVVRMGNIDLEAPNTPAMDAPGAYMPRPQMPAGMAGPGMVAPGVPGANPVPMVPYMMNGRPMLPGQPGMPPGAPMPAPGGMAPMPPGQPGQLPAVNTGGPVSQTNIPASVQQASYTPEKETKSSSVEKSSWWPFGSGSGK